MSQRFAASGAHLKAPAAHLSAVPATDLPGLSLRLATMGADKLPTLYFGTATTAFLQWSASSPGTQPARPANISPLNLPIGNGAVQKRLPVRLPTGGASRGDLPALEEAGPI
jgi:hypothetical protein